MARIYLDSCVVIYLREGTPDQKARIHARLSTASAAGSGSSCPSCRGCSRGC